MCVPRIFLFLLCYSIIGIVYSDLSDVIKADAFMFWPNGTIPFYINPDHYDHEQSMAIMTALSTFAFKTCLKFAPVLVLPENAQHIMVFENPSGSRKCSINTDGHSREQPHRIGVGYDCLKSPKIDMMIMKGLGIPFEHNRPSRDSYIDVLIENVEQGSVELFTKDAMLPSEFEHLPYDVDSVMHFGERDFSKNGHKTILFKFLEQSRDVLTPTDIRKIEIVYGPECRKRDRQEKIELCQSYPGVARKKRDAKTLDFTKSLRVNPDITPPPFGKNLLKSVTNILKEFSIDDEVEKVVDQIYKISSIALRTAKEKYCNGTKPILRSVESTPLKNEEYDIHGIVEIIANYAQSMVVNAAANLTVFCETAESVHTYQRACPFYEGRPNCPAHYRSTKSGRVEHSTRHAFHKQSTRNYGKPNKASYAVEYRANLDKDTVSVTENVKTRRKREATGSETKEALSVVKQLNSVSTVIMEDKEPIDAFEKADPSNATGENNVKREPTLTNKINSDKMDFSVNHPELSIEETENNNTTTKDITDRIEPTTTEATTKITEPTISETTIEKTEHTTTEATTEKTEPITTEATTEKTKATTTEATTKTTKSTTTKAATEKTEPTTTELTTEITEPIITERTTETTEEIVSITRETTTGKPIVSKKESLRTKTNSKLIQKFLKDTIKLLQKDDQRIFSINHIPDEEKPTKFVQDRYKHHERNFKNYLTEKRLYLPRRPFNGYKYLKDKSAPEVQDESELSLEMYKEEQKPKLPSLEVEFIGYDERKKREAKRREEHKDLAATKIIKRKNLKNRSKGNVKKAINQNKDERLKVMREKQMKRRIPFPRHLRRNKYSEDEAQSETSENVNSDLSVDQKQNEENYEQKPSSAEEQASDDKPVVPRTVPLSQINKDFYKDRRWPDGFVRYIIPGNTQYDTEDLRQRLEEVNSILKQKTCVRLQEITEDDAKRYKDYLVLDTSPDYVTGRVGGRQNFGSIELFRGGQHRQHTAMMVMAMLGFYFEVARHDRDKYIRVHMRHIRPDKLHHFEKIREDATLSLPYDYESATHPAWQFWRKIGKTGISTVATFKDKDPDGSTMKLLGQNSDLLSDTDIVKINSVYGVKCFHSTRTKDVQNEESEDSSIN